MTTERTPLVVSEPVPNYVFMTKPNRVHRRRKQQYQCWLCAAVLTTFTVAMVVLVSFYNNHVSDTDDTNPASAPLPPELNTIMRQQWPLADKQAPGWAESDVNPSKLEAAVEAGKQALLVRQGVESTAPTLNPASVSYRHQKSVRTLPQADKLAKAGYILDMATKALVVSTGKERVGGCVGKGPTIDADWLPKDVCADGPEVLPSCQASPYRSPDGSCNNLLHPHKWGVAMRPFRRALPQDYADGVSAPRVASDGGPLPSARQVSVTVHRPMYQDDPKFTVMLAVWGQFLDHDITATALSQAEGGKAIACCQTPAGMKQHPECFPVSLGDGDTYYNQWNLTCMEFVRSAPAPTCHFGPREQLNQASSYIDGSVVYGANISVMHRLRSFQGGELRMLETVDGRTLLPMSTDPADGCNQEVESAKGRYCFDSGDPRANENLHLTTMHLLWARQHNLLARKLAAINPSWTDERLFQEARKILVAQMQHITYNEFLPILLGKDLMTKLQLSPKKVGYSASYNSSVDATIANNFASAAFRFAHTLLPGLMKMLGNSTNSESYVELHKMLFNPFSLYLPGQMDSTLRGAMATVVQKFNPHFTNEITEHLFERSFSGKVPFPCGLDLVSLNIQRGRDHGLPSYPSWREHCGFPRPKTFKDLEGIMDPDSVDHITTIYRSVDDVDLYTGALSEYPVEGGVVGPTITCLITDQFVRLKFADRYWYETSQQPQGFTREQLEEIRKTSLAAVICDAGDHLVRVQPQVMRTSHPGNTPVSCAGDSLPRPNLALWKEVGGSFVRPGLARLSLGSSVTVPKIINPAIPRSIRIIGSVSASSFTTVGGYRSLSFPLAIPVDPFDSVAPPGFVAPAYPPTYGHGIQWDGSVSSLSSTRKLTVRASFSLPKYIHGHGQFNYSVLWLNGGINAELTSSLNSTGEFLLPVSGVFSSPVYFQERDEFVYLKVFSKPSTVANLVTTEDFTPFPSIYPGPTATRAPLILTGSYSADRKHFVWSGNVTMILTLPQLHEESTVEGKKPDANIEVEPKIEPNVEISTLGTVPIKGSVTMATLSVGGSSITPSFPVPIPAHPFDDVVSSYTVTSISDIIPPIYCRGIAWEGKISSVGPGQGIHATGRFSVPKFVHGPTLANFSLQWLDGDFSFEFQPQWALFPGALPPVEGTFSSPIYFQERKEYLYLKNASITTPVIPKSLYTSSPTVNAGPITPKIPIALLGAYSLDKSVFWWSGNVTVQVQYPAVFENEDSSTFGAKDSLVEVKVPASIVKIKNKKNPVPLTVKSGIVHASLLNSKSPDFTWSGVFPVTIPYPFFDRKLVTGLTPNEAFIKFEQGISWSGSVTGNSVSGYTLDGTFSLTRFLHSNFTFGFGLQSWSGKFSLAFQSTEPTVVSLVSQGVTYSSPVYFKTMPFVPAAEEFPPGASGITGISAFAPLILLGDFSLDKSSFIWSGEAILLLPTTPVVGDKMKKSKGGDVTVQPQTPDGKSKSADITTEASLPIIASVVKGYVTSGTSSWYPSFPVALPAHPFDAVYSTSAGSADLSLIPPIYGKGIVWEGKLSAPYSDGIIYAKGKFSMPKFVHGVGGFLNFSLEWLNGDFDFQFKPLLNLFSPSVPTIDSIFSSPVNLQERKEMLYLTNLTTPVPKIFPGPYDSYPDVKVGPILLKVPVSLIGSYSLDKTVFWWSGNVSIAFKYKPVSLISSVTSVKGSVTSQKSAKSIITPKLPKLPIAVTINSGSIEASLLNSNKVDFTWNGKFPVDIPYPFFDRKVVGSTASDTEPTLTVGKGLMWSGAVTKSSLYGATVQGTFSFSRFVHNSLSYSFGIDSWSGKFSLDLIVTNNISVDSLVSADTLYSSPVYFKTIPMTPVFEMTSMEMADVIPTAPSVAPLVLLGTFSPGKTSFSWSGRAIVMLPSPADSPSLVVKAAKTKTKTSTTPKPELAGFGTAQNVPVMGSVVQGTVMVTGGSDWTPTFPVAIPAQPFDAVVKEYASESSTSSVLPPIFGNGILWQGQINSPSADGIVYASGHFSMPKYIRSLGYYNFSLEWLNGDFSFQIQPLINLLSSTMPQIGGSFSSPVYFQERKEYAYMKNLDMDSVPSLNGPYTDSPTVEVGATTEEAPIILHGAFSEDKSVFWWSGSILIQIKYKLAPAFNQLNNLNLKLSKSAAGSSKGVKNAVNFTVSTGSLYANVANSTDPPFEWDGTLPVTLPNPFFDIVVKSAFSFQAPNVAKAAAGGFLKYGQGISWSGELMGNETDGYAIEGTFSFPRFLHGNVTKGFAVEIWTGNFSFNIEDIKSNVSLDTLFTATSKFSSPMVFKPLVVEMSSSGGDPGADPGYYSGKDKGGKGKDPAKNKPGKSADKSKSKFGVVATMAPITLLGDLSEDKTSFTWGGSVSIQLPATK